VVGVSDIKGTGRNDPTKQAVLLDQLNHPSAVHAVRLHEIVATRGTSWMELNRPLSDEMTPCGGSVPGLVVRLEGRRILVGEVAISGLRSTAYAREPPAGRIEVAVRVNGDPGGAFEDSSRARVLFGKAQTVWLRTTDD